MLSPSRSNSRPHHLAGVLLDRMSEVRNLLGQIRGSGDIHLQHVFGQISAPLPAGALSLDELDDQFGRVIRHARIGHALRAAVGVQVSHLERMTDGARGWIVTLILEGAEVKIEQCLAVEDMYRDRLGFMAAIGAMVGTDAALAAICMGETDPRYEGSVDILEHSFASLYRFAEDVADFARHAGICGRFDIHPLAS